VKRALAEEHGLTPPPKSVVVDLTQLLKRELKLAEPKAKRRRL
jgi:hypothetical protein